MMPDGAPGSSRWYNRRVFRWRPFNVFPGACAMADDDQNKDRDKDDARGDEQHDGFFYALLHKHH